MFYFDVEMQTTQMDINAKKLIQKLWRDCRKLTVLGAIKSGMEIAAISRDSD